MTENVGKLTFNDFAYYFGDENKEIVINLGAFSGNGMTLEGLYVAETARFNIELLQPGIEGDAIRIVADDPNANITITLIQTMSTPTGEERSIRRISTNGVLSLDGIDFDKARVYSDYELVISTDKATSYNLSFEANWTSGVDKFDFDRTGSIDSSKGGNNIADKATQLASGNYAGLMTYAGDADYYKLNTVYADELDVTITGEGLTVKEFDAAGKEIQTAVFENGQYTLSVTNGNYLYVEGNADISANAVNAYSMQISDTKSTYLAGSMIPQPTIEIEADLENVTTNLVVNATVSDNAESYYSKDLINWTKFDNTLTLNENGLYYFKAVSTNQIESNYTSLAVNNINKTVSLDGSGMTHADAIAAGYELIVTTGGTYKSNFGHDGVQARIEGGTFSCTVGGGALTSSTNYKTWDEQTGNTNLSITGGTFNKVLMGGDRVNYGNCEHVGDLNLTINGGMFNSQIVGGMAYTDQSIRGQALLTGDIYMTLAGGTFKSRIYGGCISTANYSTRTAIEGNVNIVVDSSENELIFADSVYIVAGSYQSGAIYGNVQVTFTGLGENLKMDADNLVWGGCSSDVYLINGDTRTFQSTISGTRTICFDDFTGEFNTGIRGFNIFTAENGSKLEILASNHLRDIEQWNLDWDTQLSGSFLNDFRGDTMNIDLTGWNQKATNLFDCAAGTFTGFEAMKKVTIGNETAVYSDAISGYVSTNYMLTLRDNKTMQLSMNTTIA